MSGPKVSLISGDHRIMTILGTILNANNRKSKFYDINQTKTVIPVIFSPPTPPVSLSLSDKYSAFDPSYGRTVVVTTQTFVRSGDHDHVHGHHNQHHNHVHNNRSQSPASSSSSAGAGADHHPAAADACRHKIVVMGAARVGKSSLIAQFLYRQYSAKYKRTVEEMHHGRFTVDGVKMDLDILDTSGAYEFPAMRALSISSADAFVLVYSVTDPESFRQAAAIRDQIVETKRGADVPIVVVGNKLDLADADRKVRSDDGSTRPRGGDTVAGRCGDTVAGRGGDTVAGPPVCRPVTGARRSVL